MDDAFALRFQTAGADQDLERRFVADAGYSLCDFHGLLQGNPGVRITRCSEYPAAAFAQVPAPALDGAFDPPLAAGDPLRLGVQFRDFPLCDAAQPRRKRRVISEAVQQRLSFSQRETAFLGELQ